jgi:hypothetical protein
MSWETLCVCPGAQHCPAHHPRFCGVLLTLLGVGLILFGLVPAIKCNLGTGACGQFNDALLGPGIAVAIAGTLLATIGPVAMLIGGTARGGVLRRRLQQTGVRGTARNLSVAETGLTVNDAPQVDMTLEVSVAGRPPYQVSIARWFPDWQLGD